MFLWGLGCVYLAAPLTQVPPPPHKPVLFAVVADWCPACRLLKPELSKVKGAIVLTVDYDKRKKLARQLMGKDNRLPQLILYKHGDAVVGYRSAAEIRAWIKSNAKLPQ